MLLGRDRILAALDSGAIICDPAPATVEGTHIDVRIGSHTWIMRSRAPELLDIGDADPLDWFDHYHTARAVIIPACGFVLCHTLERIGTAPGSGLLPVLHTRSTFARWSMGCHPSAGWGDVGYCSYWTLEITNTRPYAIAIPLGARVGCIAFHAVAGSGGAYEGRYNAQPDTWTPADMLPRKANI